MNWKTYLYCGFALVVLCIGIWGFLPNDSLLQEPPPSQTQNSVPNEASSGSQTVLSLELPSSLDFSGERLPLESFDVRERLNRELLVNTFWHSNTILNIQKANKYFPTIEPILDRMGVPQDLKYLAVAESSLRNVSSPAGAKGFWQFMKATGQSYGLEINSQVDERYHLEKATEAACKYFLKLKNQFGSWTLAAAAYNRGETGLRKDINSQRAESYYDLNLNDETGRYVFRIAAIKEIMSNPEKYGFFVQEAHKYQPLGAYSTIDVNTPINNWGDFAKKYGTNYRMLKLYNPWLRNSNLSNSSRKTYQIRVPVK